MPGTAIEAIARALRPEAERRLAEHAVAMLGVRVRGGAPQEAARARLEPTIALAVPTAPTAEAPPGSPVGPPQATVPPSVAQPGAPPPVVPPIQPPVLAPPPAPPVAPPPTAQPSTVKQPPGTPPGTLPKRVPRSQAAPQKRLDDADWRHNAPRVSPEVKAEARRLQEDARAELHRAQSQVAATDYGRALQTATRQAEAWLPPGAKSTWPRERAEFSALSGVHESWQSWPVWNGVWPLTSILATGESVST